MHGAYELASKIKDWLIEWKYSVGLQLIGERLKWPVWYVRRVSCTFAICWNVHVVNELMWWQEEMTEVKTAAEEERKKDHESKQQEMTADDLAAGDVYTNPLTSGHSDAQDWVSECPDVKNYKWRLNPVWHGMIYSCICMATVGVKRAYRSVQDRWHASLLLSYSSNDLSV